MPGPAAASPAHLVSPRWTAAVLASAVTVLHGVRYMAHPCHEACKPASAQTAAGAFGMYIKCMCACTPYHSVVQRWPTFG